MQVPDYCRSLDEQTVCKQAFDLIFAFDEVVAMGYKEKVTVQQVKQFVEMDSQEEKIFEMIQRVSMLGTYYTAHILTSVCYSIEQRACCQEGRYREAQGTRA